MPARALDIGEMEAVLASIEADCLAAPAVLAPAPAASAPARFSVPDVSAPGVSAEIDELSEPVTEDGSCLRAFGFAIVLEAAAAAFLFGAWQLWRFVR